MYIGVKEVKTLPHFKLLILFENGEQRVFDVSSYLDHGVFRALKDPALFHSAHVSFDAVTWANGADLCPEVLYRDSTPVDDTQVQHSADKGKTSRAKTTRHPR